MSDYESIYRNAEEKTSLIVEAIKEGAKKSLEEFFNFNIHDLRIGASIDSKVEDIVNSQVQWILKESVVEFDFSKGQLELFNVDGFEREMSEYRTYCDLEVILTDFSEIVPHYEGHRIGLKNLHAMLLRIADKVKNLSDEIEKEPFTNSIDEGY